VWTQVNGGRPLSWATTVLAALVLVASVLASLRGREGWACALKAGCLALVVISLFATLYPHVMVSSTNPLYSLTTTNASSGHYTLTVMTWVAVVMTPFVLLYQTWTYWVFRARVGPGHIPAPLVPHRG
jgi:cytochrome d ubiquinol oxidase subunit II